MQFESKKLYDNIQFLIKNDNLKIGDVEKELGCSSGYFARLKKDDASYSAPSDYSRFFEPVFCLK